jgi:hypothetical protein
MKYYEAGENCTMRSFVTCILSSPSTIIMIKSRRMSWSWHVARMTEKRNAYRILVGNPEERDHYEDIHVGGRIILRWSLER